MSSGNPVLDKNLECINNYNPELVEQILNLPHLENHIDLIETDLKEPNLIYNGIPLHSQSGAEAEAQKLFEGVKNTNLSIHVVFGLGLGYLFQEVCQKSKGTVILYEPNLEIIRVTLELVDFSKELSLPNVFITSDRDFGDKIFGQFYKYRTDSPLLMLDSYRNFLHQGDIDEVIYHYQTLLGSYDGGIQYLKESRKRSVTNVLENLKDTLDAIPLSQLKDVYKGKTALIVSAGPTLDDNIETIKKYRDSLVIFCVGTAFRALANKGINPDFVAVIEINDVSGQFDGLDTSKVNLITEAFTNNALYKLKVNQNFIHVSPTINGNTFWANLTGVDISDYYTRGTVAYCALNSAKILGCKKLVLVGQDLAFVKNKVYSDNATYSGMVIVKDEASAKHKIVIQDEEDHSKFYTSVKGADAVEEMKQLAENKLKLGNAAMYQVMGINGEMLPTLAILAAFVGLLTEFAENNPDLELINTSMIGAQVDGFENVPLEKTLDGLNEKIDLVTNFTPYEYDWQKILQNLSKEKEELKRVLKQIDLAKEYIFKYQRDIKRLCFFDVNYEKNQKDIKSLYLLSSALPEAEQQINQLMCILAKKLHFEGTKIQYKYVKLLNKLFEELNSQNYEKCEERDENDQIIQEKRQIGSSIFQALSYNDKIEIQFLLDQVKDYGLVEITVLFELFKDYYNNLGNNILDVIEIFEENEEYIKKQLEVKMVPLST